MCVKGSNDDCYVTYTINNFIQSNNSILTESYLYYFY